MYSTYKLPQGSQGLLRVAGVALMSSVRSWSTLVAEFISPPKVYTFSSIVANIIPKSVKCIQSVTKSKVCLPRRKKRKACG